MTFNVTVWDTDKQDFVPCLGVRKGPYKQWAVRQAIRELFRRGYDTCSILVERREPEPEEAK